MKTTIQKTIGLLAVVVVLSACSKDNGQGPEETGCPVVEEFLNTAVRIKEATTWTNDKIYRFTNTIVEVESELTIEPGTIMKFDNSSISVRPGKNGQIIANGTADKRIVFTSYADNAHCGNTQAEAGKAEPEKGDWGAFISMVGITTALPTLISCMPAEALVMGQCRWLSSLLKRRAIPSR